MAELIDEAKAAYLFLDEGGNFDFSRGGTKYFTLTSVLVLRPFKFDSPLTELRFDLIEAGLNKEYFHASEDEHRPDPCEQKTESNREGDQDDAPADASR